MSDVGWSAVANFANTETGQASGAVAQATSSFLAGRGVGGATVITNYYSPSILFAGGTAGAWYDPSDLTTLFTTSAGTTQCAMPGQGSAVSVGLMLDKSQGLVLGSELVTNGDFDTNVNGWTLTIQTGGTGTFTWDAGKGRLTVVGTFVHQVNQGISVTAGKWYKITGKRFLISGAATASVSIRDTTDPVTSVVLGGAVVNAGASSDSFSLYYLATSTTTVYLAFRNGNNGAITDIDNISVRELPGNHAIAFNNTTARPELRARVNLLTYSEEFDNGAWTPNNVTITANQAVAPNGTLTADKIVAANGTDGTIRQDLSFVSGVSYTMSIRAKKEDYNFVLLAFGSTAFPASNRIGLFNLNTGQVASASQSGINATITPLGNDWYQCSITQTANATALASATFASRPTDSLSGTGNGTSGIYIWGADLRPANIGANVPAYQRIADALTYDTSGFPLYLYFDGTDDSMYTPANLNLSGTDKVAVFAGARKLSDAAAAILTELSAVSATTDGSFAIVASTIDGGADRLSYGFNARGTVTAVVRTARSYAAPITNVVTGQYDNAAATIPTQIVMRVDGVTPTTQADPFGPTSAGNFGTYPLFIGSRNNSSRWFNGHLYSLVVAGSAVSAGNISATEQWVAGKTGIQI